MLEMVVLNFAKETDEKFRWDASVDGTNFELYIPKWRVPNPRPSRILVGIEETGIDNDLSMTRSNLEYWSDPKLRRESIIAMVSRDEEKTKTMKYRPDGAKGDWQIGPPYIPFALT